MQARAILRQVRQVLNEYRDDRREGLVRVRNHLLVSIVITGLLTDVLLAIAIIRLAPVSTIVAAAVFYLVGALVGLFNRLYAQSKTTNDIEDYGLFQARLILTPLLSGLAALGGVLLVAIIPVVTPQQPNATPQLVGLDNIFDLGNYKAGLLVAAIFGFTPGLIVERLKQQTDQYKAELQRSEVGKTPSSEPQARE